MVQDEGRRRKAYARASRSAHRLSRVAGDVRDCASAAVLGFHPPAAVFDLLDWNKYFEFINSLSECEWRRGRPVEHQAHFDYYEGPLPWGRNPKKMLLLTIYDERYDLLDYAIGVVDVRYWEKVLIRYQPPLYFRQRYLPQVLARGADVAPLLHQHVLMADHRSYHGAADVLPLFVPYVTRDICTCFYCQRWLQTVLG